MLNYLSIWFESIWDGGELRVMESENKSDWNWYTVEEALRMPIWDLDRALISKSISREPYGYPESLPKISFEVHIDQLR